MTGKTFLGERSFALRERDIAEGRIIPPDLENIMDTLKTSQPAQYRKLYFDIIENYDAPWMEKFKSKYGQDIPPAVTTAAETLSEQRKSKEKIDFFAKTAVPTAISLAAGYINPAGWVLKGYPLLTSLISSLMGYEAGKYLTNQPITPTSLAIDTFGTLAPSYAGKAVGLVKPELLQKAPGLTKGIAGGTASILETLARSGYERGELPSLSEIALSGTISGLSEGLLPESKALIKPEPDVQQALKDISPELAEKIPNILLTKPETPLLSKQILTSVGSHDIEVRKILQDLLGQSESSLAQIFKTADISPSAKELPMSLGKDMATTLYNLRQKLANAVQEAQTFFKETPETLKKQYNEAVQKLDSAFVNQNISEIQKAKDNLRTLLKDYQKRLSDEYGKILQNLVETETGAQVSIPGNKIKPIIENILDDFASFYKESPVLNAARKVQKHLENSEKSYQENILGLMQGLITRQDIRPDTFLGQMFVLLNLLKDADKNIEFPVKNITDLIRGLSKPLNDRTSNLIASRFKDELLGLLETTFPDKTDNFIQMRKTWRDFSQNVREPIETFLEAIEKDPKSAIKLFGQKYYAEEALTKALKEIKGAGIFERVSNFLRKDADNAKLAFSADIGGKGFTSTKEILESLTSDDTELQKRAVSVIGKYLNENPEDVNAIAKYTIFNWLEKAKEPISFEGKFKVSIIPEEKIEKLLKDIDIFEKSPFVDALKTGLASKKWMDNLPVIHDITNTLTMIEKASKTDEPIQTIFSALSKNWTREPQTFSKVINEIRQINPELAQQFVDTSIGRLLYAKDGKLDLVNFCKEINKLDPKTLTSLLNNNPQAAENVKKFAKAVQPVAENIENILSHHPQFYSGLRVSLSLLSAFSVFTKPWVMLMIGGLLGRFTSPLISAGIVLGAMSLPRVAGYHIITNGEKFVDEIIRSTKVVASSLRRIPGSGDTTETQE